METNQEVRRREWLGRGLAVLVGLAVGYIANDKLGNHFVFHELEHGTLRMNSRTGQTWFRSQGLVWTPFDEPKSN